jgi:hypothetical protein
MAKEEQAIISSPNEIPAEAVFETPVEVKPKMDPGPSTPETLEEKVLKYINMHPLKGVKVSEMEVPLGETRMKLGFITKVLLEHGKVQKMDNVYFPIK